MDEKPTAKRTREDLKKNKNNELANNLMFKTEIKSLTNTRSFEKEVSINYSVETNDKKWNDNTNHHSCVSKNSEKEVDQNLNNETIDEQNKNICHKLHSDEIARHYNQIKPVLFAERKKSTIINIRNMNNFIKSILLNLYIKENSKVLDLGCGKGGDLLKFKKIGISYYHGMDIAEESIKECKVRYNRFGCMFNAEFQVYDVYNKVFDLNQKFDAVSIQFSFHYAFETKNSFATTLSNIDNHLASNGYLLLTVPDKNVILRRYNRYKNKNLDHNTEKVPKNSISAEFGNKYYCVKFYEPISDKIFGNKYYFHLFEAINGCVEFLVDMEFLVKKAKEIDLELIESSNFLNFYNDNSKKFANLRRKMLPKRLEFEEIQVMELYRIVVFQKVKK